MSLHAKLGVEGFLESGKSDANWCVCMLCTQASEHVLSRAVNYTVEVLSGALSSCRISVELVE